MIKNPVKTIGIIIFRLRGKKIEYLLLRHYGKYWNFPKGRQEIGESEPETAFREVYEETGLPKENIRLISGFKYGYIYKFKSKFQEDFGQVVIKQSIFYLGEYLAGQIKISDEHLNYGWFAYSQARQRLYYKNGRNLLIEADFFIKKSKSG